MVWLNNKRYEPIVEFINVYNNKFTVAQRPVYGLVNINGMIVKVNNYESIYPIDGQIKVCFYKEKLYTDRVHEDELNQDEIYNMLITDDKI